ncbi:hypothetical protein FB567DRAFT_538764 [Paraphoma chrysanthemicola]|uniref:F-box domain-containing protein n=1 Tax=Paraphoma chrysanthemicola TaxID=798071 RepID=A0A8K0QVZ1_9PLEO|nr:hypothetical protein FB567DRAFT_538764 [Paraphoma chrysanthemicola]
MSQLEKLPNELLCDIVDRVSATSFESLPNLALACKRLHNLSAPLLWNHVLLPWRLNMRSPIARFIVAHRGNKNIRALRLQPQRSILNAFRIGMKHAFDHLDALCECLGSLSGLKTFSLFLDGLVDSRCTLPGPVLARIVRALPPSIIHLELDTECIDRIYEDELVKDPNDHLCLAISDRVPYLETLRVRLSCICLGLFSSLTSTATTRPKSKLQRAFIRCDTSPNSESHLGITSQVCDCRLPQFKVGSRGQNYEALAVDKLAALLLCLQTAGSFPDLQRFILFSWQGKDNKFDNQLHIRDIATRSTTHYPAKYTLRGGNDLNVPELEDKDYTCYMIRSHDSIDFVGDRKDLESAILHEVAWKELPTGVRLAPTGRLPPKTPRLCTDGLVSASYLRIKEQEFLSSGAIEEPWLPDAASMSRAAVIVDEE